MSTKSLGREYGEHQEIGQTRLSACLGNESRAHCPFRARSPGSGPWKPYFLCLSRALTGGHEHGLRGQRGDRKAGKKGVIRTGKNGKDVEYSVRGEGPVVSQGLGLLKNCLYFSSERFCHPSAFPYNSEKGAVRFRLFLHTFRYLAASRMTSLTQLYFLSFFCVPIYL